MATKKPKPKPKPKAKAKPKSRQKKAKQPSAAQVAERNSYVQILLLSGLGRADIIKQLKKDLDAGNIDFKMAPRTVDSYIKSATEIIHKDIASRDAVRVDETIARFDFIYKMQCAEKDYRGASKTLKALSDMAGLNAPFRHEVSGKDGEDLKPTTVVVMPAK